MSGLRPMVSVVVPTYNRRESLAQMLRSLELQSYPGAEFEVIVVDDGSTDGTEQTVEEFRRNGILALTGVPVPHGGPGAARNVGVGIARGEIIAFTEDDVVADPGWLTHAMTCFDDPTVAGVEGSTSVQGSSAPLRAFDPGNFLSFIPCNLFLRKDVFLKCGGYDPAFFHSLTGNYFREDIDLGFALLERGYRVVKSAEAIVAHPEQFHTSNAVFRHLRRYYFDPLLYKKHPASYRASIEAKEIGILRIRRPFHYLCLFYLFGILSIFLEGLSGRAAAIPYVIPALLVIVAGIQWRYRRQPGTSVRGAIIFFIVPFYYFYWLVRGCAAFRSWALLF